MSFTIADVNRTIRELAAERPDFVYRLPNGQIPDATDTCQYVHVSGGTLRPGCLIGHALYALGVPLSELHARENSSAVSIISAFVNVSSLLGWADFVQQRQDRGLPWGQCVLLADLADKNNDQF